MPAIYGHLLCYHGELGWPDSGLLGKLSYRIWITPLGHCVVRDILQREAYMMQYGRLVCYERVHMEHFTRVSNFLLDCPVWVPGSTKRPLHTCIRNGAVIIIWTIGWGVMLGGNLTSSLSLGFYMKESDQNNVGKARDAFFKGYRICYVGTDRKSNAEPNH